MKNGRIANERRRQPAIVKRHFKNKLVAPERFGDRVEKGDYLDLRFSSSPSPYLIAMNVGTRGNKVDEEKLRVVKRKLFEDVRDKNLGIRNDLKLKISMKKKELRNYLEPRNQKKILKYPKFKLPVPVFLDDNEQMSYRNKTKLEIKVGGDRRNHQIKKVPDSFKPAICSTPFKAQPRDSGREDQQDPSLFKLPAEPCDFDHQQRDLKARPKLGLKGVRPELDYTQDKMVRVREWMEKPETKSREKKPRDQLDQGEEVRPELDFTKGKMTKVMQRRQNFQPETVRVRIPSELEFTQDKIERVREWRQEIKPRCILREETKPRGILREETKPRGILRKEIKPRGILRKEIKPMVEPVSTLQNYQTMEEALRKGNTRLPPKSCEPESFMTYSFLNPRQLEDNTWKNVQPSKRGLKDEDDRGFMADSSKKFLNSSVNMCNSLENVDIDHSNNFLEF